MSTSGGGRKRILDNIAYAYLDEDALAVFMDPTLREQLRIHIVTQFFTVEQQQKLLDVIERERRIDEYQHKLTSEPTQAVREASAAEKYVRDVAFSRTIRTVYDYQCAMCGLRIIAPDGSTPVDAAHLIPWSLSHDDTPGNGIALCKLHHWAMDTSLAAPSPDMTWVISPQLDSRRNAERELTRFEGLKILLPNDERFHPRLDAIKWRFGRLFK